MLCLQVWRGELSSQGEGSIGENGEVFTFFERMLFRE